MWYLRGQKVWKSVLLLQPIIPLITNFKLKLQARELWVKLRAHSINCGWRVCKMCPTLKQFMFSVLNAVTLSFKIEGKILSHYFGIRTISNDFHIYLTKASDYRRWCNLLFDASVDKAKTEEEAELDWCWISIYVDNLSEFKDFTKKQYPAESNRAFNLLAQYLTAQQLIGGYKIAHSFEKVILTSRLTNFFKTSLSQLFVLIEVVSHLIFESFFFLSWRFLIFLIHYKNI